MDILSAVFLGILLYAACCFLIAAFRLIFAKPGKRHRAFGHTFWSLFLEILNPFAWF